MRVLQRFLGSLLAIAVCGVLLPGCAKTFLTSDEVNGVGDQPAGDTKFADIAPENFDLDVNALFCVSPNEGAHCNVSSGNDPAPGGNAWFPQSLANLLDVDLAPRSLCGYGNEVCVGGAGGLVCINGNDLSVKKFTGHGLDDGNTVTAVRLVDSDTAVGCIQNTAGSGSAGLVICNIPQGTCQPAAGPPTTFSPFDGCQSLVVVDTPQIGVPNKKLLAGFVNGGVWRTEDGGGNWQSSNTGITIPGANVYAFARTTNAIVIGTNVGAYRSVNGGFTWTRITSGLPAAVGFYVDISAIGDEVFMAIQSTTPAVYRSIDGGLTWQATPSLGVARVNSVRDMPNGVFVATSSGVLKMTVERLRWNEYNAGLHNLSILSVHQTASGKIFAGTFQNGIGLIVSDDGGLTWKAAGRPTTDNKLIRAIISAGNNVLASGETGFLLSTDGGLTFRVTTGNGLPGGSSFPYAFASIGNTIVAVLEAGGVYKTVNGGVDWTSSSIGLPPGIGGYSIAASGNTLVFGTAGTVFISENAGASWSAGGSPSPTQPYLVVALTFSNDVLYAGTLGFGVPETHGLFKSPDHGRTFFRSQDGIPSNTPVFGLAADDSNVYAATRGGFYTSQDSGADWNEYTLGPITGATLFSVLKGATPPSGTYPVNRTRTVDFAATPPSRVFAGTAGRGVWTLSVPATVRRLVPIVLDVAGVAHFTSELVLTNRGTTSVQVSMLYTASIGTGSGTATIALAAGQQLVIPDAIAFLSAQGIPIPTGSVGGTLLLTFTGVSGSNVVSAVARTTAATASPQPEGNAGLAYAAVDPAEGSTGLLTLYGLRATASDRTNVAVYSTSATPVTLEVTAFSGAGDGASFVIAASDTLPPWGWKQYNGVLATAGFTNGWVRVRRVSTTGSFGAYGVINDNGTSDGSFVLPAGPESRPQYLNVPALVETSAFHSELVLTNASSKTANFVLSYRESLAPGGGSGGTATVAVPPKTQMIQPGAIAYLRSKGLTIGPAGAASYAGSLHVFVQGAPVNQAFAGARTASQSPAGGQFGLFTPPFFAGQEATGAAYLYGLRADATNRSNVAMINTAASAGAGSVTLQLQAYDGDAGGAAAGAPDSVTLGPGEWRQLGNYLAGKGMKNGWVKITRTSGTAPWIAYAVINDGGAPGDRTGDGAYVPMVL